MNPKEKNIIEGVALILFLVIIFGWLVFRSFVSNSPVTPPALAELPVASLQDPVLDQLSTDLSQTEKFYQVPVPEPTVEEKDKGTLAQ